MPLADRGDRVGEDLVRAVGVRETLAEVDAAGGDGPSGHFCEDRGPKALHAADKRIVPWHLDKRRPRWRHGRNERDRAPVSRQMYDKKV